MIAIILEIPSLPPALDGVRGGLILGIASGEAVRADVHAVRILHNVEALPLVSFAIVVAV